MFRRASVKLVHLLLLALLAPSVAYAQGSIAGVVKDPSGAVLPGATVEASSPALIEKVRAVVTDGTGQYKIVDLRPGTYSVTFALPGFNTVKREGIELTGSFAAAVNVELKVGAVEETITVSGEAPTVYIQSVTQQRVMSKDVLDSIPSGRSHFNVTVLLPGVTTSAQDVGGTNSLQLTNISVHGGSTGDTRVQVDGISTQNNELTGNSSNYLTNMGSTQNSPWITRPGQPIRPTAAYGSIFLPRGRQPVSGSMFATVPATSSGEQLHRRFEGARPVEPERAQLQLRRQPVRRRADPEGQVVVLHGGLVSSAPTSSRAGGSTISMPATPTPGRMLPIPAGPRSTTLPRRP
jgi:hypothetical protein